MARTFLYQANAFVRVPTQASAGPVGLTWQVSDHPRFVVKVSASVQIFNAWTAALLTTVLNSRSDGYQPLNPEVFVKRFPVTEQQYFTGVPAGSIATTATPQGWQGNQLEYRYATTFPVTAQQFAGWPAIPLSTLSNSLNAGYTAVSPELFQAPFAVSLQQFDARRIGLAPTTQVPGWWGQKLEYVFATPFPVQEQQFSAFGRTPPSNPTPHGWEGQQLERQFVKPIPPSRQQYDAELLTPFPLAFGLNTGYLSLFDYFFKKPLASAQHQFSAWTPSGAVPIFYPPGAGKRKDFPSYLPQPSEEKASKPVTFRPIWDKGPPEQPKAAPQPLAPIPLPPPEAFGTAQPAQSGLLTNQLPTFAQHAPHDPLGLMKRMQDTEDMSDAIAVLQSLGLIGPNNGG